MLFSLFFTWFDRTFKYFFLNFLLNILTVWLVALSAFTPHSSVDYFWSKSGQVLVTVLQEMLQPRVKGAQLDVQQLAERWLNETAGS